MLAGAVANSSYLLTCAVAAFEVDTEDMMTLSANSLSIPARERLYPGEKR